MSQHSVDQIVRQLLGDEELRLRFALDRIDTLAELQHQHLTLTSAELDLFLTSDIRVWFSAPERCPECQAEASYSRRTLRWP